MKFTGNSLRITLLASCIIFIKSVYPQLSSSAENGEIGKVFIQHYSPKDYKSSPQNFSILCDNRGIIYAGNNLDAVLEYDGVNWRQFRLGDQQLIWTLAMDKNGRIYIGRSKDFGYLTPDKKCVLEYSSLLKYLKDKEINFSGIRSIYPTRNGVYFCSREYLFRWKNNNINFWKPETEFTGFFLVHDSLYVLEKHKSLMVLKDDSLVLRSGGKIFLDKPVKAMFPVPEAIVKGSSVLVGIDGEGLFLYDWRTLKPLEGKTNEFVKQFGIRCTSILNDTTFAAGLEKGGVIIFNYKGELIQYLTKSSGLRNNIVYSIAPDHKGGIWMASLQGIDHLMNIYPSFSVFDQQKGLDGVVAFNSPPVRHRNILYVATSEGVYYLDKQQNRFFLVAGLSGDFWKLFKNGKYLYAIRGSIRKIDGDNSEVIKRLKDRVSCIRRSMIDPDKYYIGCFNGGIKILRKTDNDWIESPKINKWKGDAALIAEDRNGDIWLNNENKGISRIHISPDGKVAKVENFGKEQGLPSFNNYPFLTSRGVFFTTNKNLYIFDSTKYSFIRDTTFNKLLPDNSFIINYLTEDKKGNVWAIVSKDINYYLNIFRMQANGTYRIDNNDFLGIPSNGIWSIYAEDNGITWFGGEEGLFRYDDNLPESIHSGFPVYIRSIVINGDSVAFGGYSQSNKSKKPVELNYAVNSVQFNYAASFYDHAEKNSYMVFLEGFDKGWSNWLSETNRTYTNLSPGNYTFRVKAKNIYGNISSEDTFSMIILPPLYLTWWAYILYVVIFTSLFILIINVYNKRKTKHLTYRTNELEKLVAERTAELAEKNTELHELSKIRSRFFANISHEFRTPLTLIVGQIENLLPDLKKEHNIERAKMALRNSKQLQQLINQLLDLSKFDAREMKLKVSRKDIVAIIRYITGSFESLALKKRIDLKFETSVNNIPVYFEQDKIEKVMHNLLSNAVKFTRDEGEVRVSIEIEIRADKNTASMSSEPENVGDVKIKVADSGIGIPMDRLPHVFDRFFQVDNSTTREYEGTGIGLALTKELVQIHGGGISVESKEGSGTTFTIILPLGKSHLEPDQIIETEKGVPGQENNDYDNVFEYKKELEELTNQVNRTDQGVKSKIILIVEDNPDMRSYIRDTLGNDYNIAEASNGAEGLQHAVDEIPDLIITDVMMPVIDGYELTRKLRKNLVTSHIPVIMLTAKAEENDKFEGLETGVDAFLIKPFSTKELMIRTRNLIEIREQMKKNIGSKAVLTPSEISASSIDQQFLEKMSGIIEKNMGDEKFGVDVLAEQIGISKRQLLRKLKALTDCTPNQCIRIMRLRRAKQLLEQDAGNVTEIAFSVGYTDLTAFSRAFKEEFNQLPSAVILKKI
ncbi:MAG: hybrid sensor histidine kinase/response regulator transcription factor [Ignavibacteriaceae bacterium]